MPHFSVTAGMVTALPLILAAAGLSGPERDGQEREANAPTTIRIRLASIFVSDQETALAFYTDVVGLVKKEDIPVGQFRWLTVVSPNDPEGTELLLEPNVNPAAVTFQQAIFEQNIPATALAVDDIQAEYARLMARGVRFATEPTDVGTATIAVFDDTCGNLIQLYQTKG